MLKLKPPPSIWELVTSTYKMDNMGKAFIAANVASVLVDLIENHNSQRRNRQYEPDHDDEPDYEPTYRLESIEEEDHIETEEERKKRTWEEYMKIWNSVK